MDLKNLVNKGKFEFYWLDPQSEKVLVLKYVQPWKWSDAVGFAQDNVKMLNSIDYKFAMVHDFSLYPNETSSAGDIHDSLWAKAPPMPSNLVMSIVVSARMNILLEMGFEIVEKAMFRRKINYFVDSMEAAKTLLIQKGLI